MTDQSSFFPLAMPIGRPAGSAGRAVFKSQSQWLAEAEAQAAAEAAARAAARAARRAAAAGCEPASESTEPVPLLLAPAPEAERSALLPEVLDPVRDEGSGEAAPAAASGADRADPPLLFKGGDRGLVAEAEASVLGEGESHHPQTPSSKEEGASETEPDEAPDPELANWTPPPRKPGKPRHNEWTRQKMALFLRELAASQSVAQAARSVGMSRQSAYRLRARLVGTPFAFGWEVALEAGLAQLAHAMMDRAVNGVEVPHYHAGELVGTSRRYDERLAIWLMSNPWKVGRQQIAREYSAEGFDRLLERIETGPLDWEGLDGPDEADDLADGEGAEAAARAEGPPDQLPGLLPPAPSAVEASERQTAFMVTRSWYGGGAGEESREARRWRGR